MLNRFKKINAFTLNEMLVVLLITVIVVGMAFAVLNLVQGQMNSITGNYNKNTEINLLRRALWIDFNTYNKVVVHLKRDELQFVNELQVITYQLLEDKIIREKDTFNIKPHTIKYYLSTVPRTSGEIDAMDLSSDKKSGSQRVFVFKNSVAVTYMNL